ncbi:hypothetical protein PsYK624_086070 [Phanerochaete sordida]|uniref:Uncharacterized protein n=1 Tax=Phanerochaete sordida TaxID=48140 RepID=A0A9P3GCN5_9APHY|nr:hypothetical protein PsYK624_086070 [Phanerochaete sordida]
MFMGRRLRVHHDAIRHTICLSHARKALHCRTLQLSRRIRPNCFWHSQNRHFHRQVAGARQGNLGPSPAVERAGPAVQDRPSNVPRICTARLNARHDSE